MAIFSSTRARHYFLLFVVALPLFFWNLGDASLWDLDEGRNATAAWEMYLSNDWVVPTFNGEIRAHKPVLQYWLIVLGMHLWGASEWVVRLPSALAALGTVLVTYELARRLFSAATGLLAGFVIATTPMLLGAAHFANPDALLNFFTALTLFCFWRAFERSSYLAHACMGAAAGFAVLAKGPVGIVLPGAIMILFLAWNRRLDFFWDRRYLASVIAFIVVAIPWYALVGVATKFAFLREFLLTHNVSRALTPMENHRGSILYYPMVLTIGLTPWSLLAVAGLWAGGWSCLKTAPTRGLASFPVLWKKNADGAGRGGAAGYRLLVLWIAVFLACFTIAATKLPNYVLPTSVPLALLAARIAQRWAFGLIDAPRWFTACIVAGLALLGIGFSAGMIIASGVGEFSILRGRFFPNLGPLALAGIAPLATAVVVGRLLWLDRRRDTVRVLVIGAFLFLAPVAAWGPAVFNDAKASSSLATAPPSRTDIDLLVVGLDVGHLPSAHFYLRRNIVQATSLSDLAVHLSYPLPVYALVPAPIAEQLLKEYPHSAREIARHPDLYRGKSIVLLANDR